MVVNIATFEVTDILKSFYIFSLQKSAISFFQILWLTLHKEGRDP